MRKTAYLTHASCLMHDMGQQHPECAARLHAINDQLIAQRLADFLVPVDAVPATREQLQRVHSADYIDVVFERAPASGYLQLDTDVVMNPHSLSAALHAAGAVVQAVELVLNGAVNNAFCAVRPPGHHAERERAMGFCIFNNIAVGAAHALAVGGLSRVAIVDFDLHHGNGTEEIFGGDARVLYCSSYQFPFYPFPDATRAASNIVHSPLPAGSGGAALRQLYQQQWLPALTQWQPDMLFISAGFDAHSHDPLGQLRFVEDDYQWLTAALVRFADDHCGGRVVSALEGGYDLDALGRSAAVHIKALMGLT